MTSAHREMNAQRLTSLTSEAITAVMCFHTGRGGQITRLPEMYQETIRDAVQRVYHLREQAKDTDVAHLEIACDAAVAFANKYNETSFGDAVNPRWLYHCVQSLLSLRLKPELMLDGKVNRLLPARHEHDDRDTSLVSLEAEGSTLSSIPSVASPTADEPDVDVEIMDTSEPEDIDRPRVAATVAIKDPKTPWTEDNIREMVRLKTSGMTHEEVAAHVGRGKGSVENKYGRVMKEQFWKDYRNDQRANRAAVKKRNNGKRASHDRDVHGEEQDEDEADDGDEGEASGTASHYGARTKRARTSRNQRQG